ncbi:TPA: hypothetical protein N0F65_006094 [Lagenidium giganteum]|uniref:Rab-GAP TBC domain-containing protein n=1 Tax=Lagenidium giganteum TaxID=4803 RepID=A0AAV2Z4A0_9STRA|nr:TPA: hypothetical protein N0F65_006094 [Lagenidium giganteum]
MAKLYLLMGFAGMLKWQWTGGSARADVRSARGAGSVVAPTAAAMAMPPALRRVEAGDSARGGANPERDELFLRRYGSDVRVDERVLFLTEQLLQQEHVGEWKQVLRRELSKPDYVLHADAPTPAQAQALLLRVIEKTGLLTSIRRSIVDLHCEAAQVVQAAAARKAKEEERAFLIPEMQLMPNGLDAVSRAREQWDAITREEMIRFAKEINKPLVTPKAVVSAPPPQPPSEAESALASVGLKSSTNKQSGAVATRFLYDSKDLLHTLQAIKPTNRHIDSANVAPWGSIQLQLNTLTSLELQRRFVELAPTVGQIGLDDLFPVERQAFIQEKLRVGDIVLGHQSMSMARQYAKTGCPSNLRPGMWRQALSVVPTPELADYFQTLQTRVQRWNCLTDEMYMLDLQQALDSCDYFVFQDQLETVIMAFSRDSHVLEHALQINGSVPAPATAGDKRFDSPFVPPNGVLPFSGLVMYLAPLTYLYADELVIYFVFREMYERYWCKLNTIRTESSTILALCKLFEDLVMRSASTTVFHLLNVGIKPLEIVFPWIQSAFSGVLQIEQVLLLWDRVIGYDSLELVPVLAAALFHFRADELEAVATMNDVRELFDELMEIQVIPLVQEYLFLVA